MMVICVLFRDVSSILDGRAKVAMAKSQRCRESTLHLPAELNELIFKFADYDEFRALFDLLNLASDRQQLMGFESYRDWDEAIPTRKAKSRFLIEMSTKPDGPLFQLDKNNKTITTIDWRYRKLNSFNWPTLRWFGSLEKLILCSNKLSGTIDWAALPRSLESLVVSNNKLSGTIDRASLPPRLSGLYLSHNKFSGSFNASFLTFFFSLANPLDVLALPKGSVH